MRLDGKVNKIERIMAKGRRDGVEDEKRVFHLNVRLPDRTLEAQYTYGYGNMHFILHGKAMTDFVDLGGEVDIYVVAKGGEVPDRDFENMQTELYRLQGEVDALTHSKDHLLRTNEILRQESQAVRARLTVAMEEVMRLEIHQGKEPPATALLANEEDEA